MLNADNLYAFITKQWEDSIIPSLCEFIKIPNKSPHFDHDWEKHGFMDKAVQHVVSWCKANAPRGLALEVIRQKGKTPLIYMEIPGETEDTILLYGHLDKQPEMTGWDKDHGPWDPVIKDGRLYGRGAADDGYAAYAALTAICALQEQEVSHPRCVIIIEASEESGSQDLPFYIETLKDKIGTPNLIICLDSGAGNYDQLWMTTSLRGNIVGELSVELLKEGIHSGYGSGIAADSFRVIRALLSRIEHEQTGEVIVEELQCDIPPERINEAAEQANVLDESVYQSLPFHSGVKPVTSNIQQLLLNRTWRAALTITGAEGLPAIEDAGNVLRPKTTLKLSMRIPPLTNADKAAEVLERKLTHTPPYKAKIRFKVEDKAPGWHAPIMPEWLSEAVNEASMKFYKKPAMYMGEGGTIPFMAMLGKAYPKAEFMITGVLGPNSNAHGPNEFLHLDMAKKLTACVAFVIHKKLESNSRLG
ncbi:M20/M25/M40 family metallo-hydrolase [Legionella impletisoli]|uniref:Peptidase M20 n=1 Tax=Legionella impletisoli TaxID=343510 RepID=A0A917JYI7_9GAMM|nr:M20/M25/M40 family metallo-hydrolase [Legionella impletisoli]GGI91561.1 peptidase M20 [Legionella impletisoli]